MQIDVEGPLLRTSQEMQEAQDALIRLGFPEEQWSLIAKYIASAIEHGAWKLAKSEQALKQERASRLAAL
jgi:hypothetical protein